MKNKILFVIHILTFIVGMAVGILWIAPKLFG